MEAREAFLFLERDDVLGEFEQALAAGGGRALAIEGDAGIGKTRLLAEAARLDAVDGWTILSARGGELEQGFAFGVVRQLFERATHELDEDARAAAFAGPARHAEAVLTESNFIAVPSTATMHAALNGVFWLTANLAQSRPLLLLVDDAHWADEASQRWMDFLVRRIEDVPAVLVFASRPARTSALPVGGGIRHVRLEPLTAFAEAQLVRASLGDETPATVIDACHIATGGNPFLIAELTDALRASPEVTPRLVAELTPLGVTVDLRARLRPLPEAAGRLIAAAAVFGQGAELRHVAALADLDLGEAAGVVGDVVTAGLFEPAELIDFRHPLLRAAAYGEIPPPRRAHEHRRAADLLLADGRRGDAAAHLLRAHAAGDPETVEVLREVAGDALRRGAPETAVRHLRRALTEPPAAELLPSVLRELGTAELLVQDPAAPEHLAAALAGETVPFLRMFTGRLLTAAFTFAARREDAAALTAQLLATLPDDPALRTPVEADRLFLATLTQGIIDGDRLDERLRARIDAIHPGQESPDDLLALAACTLFGLATGRPPAEVVALARRAFADGGLLEMQGTETPVSVQPAFALMCNGHYEEALRWFDKGLETAHSHGSVYGFVHWCTWRAECAWRSGDLRRAEADARAVLAMEGTIPAILQLFAGAALLSTLVARGELDEAEAVLGQLTVDRKGEDVISSALALRGRAHLRRAQGRHEEALADWLVVHGLQTDFGWTDGVMDCFKAELSQTLRVTGDRAGALAHGREALAIARGRGNPAPLGIALRALGQAQDGDEGIETLRAAVDALGASEARLEHARALVDLGAMLRRHGRRNDARPFLAAGLDLAQQLGAAPLADTAEDELRISGAKPRRRALTGIDALTASEHRVAALAAAGQSNREIAQRLFLTVKTVEMHLGSAYRKLGIAGRAELPDELAA